MPTKTPASAMNPKVNFYFEKETKWHKEMALLRKIVLSTGLTEELKWGVPCYTLDSKNIVLIHGFKDYCALLFMKGALMKDPEAILIQQTENVQAGRHIRFTHAEEIVELKPVLNQYIEQAIEIERAGLKVRHKETAEYKMPDELIAKLEEPKFKKAFEALTPGRQRGYIFYFGQAKQSATRLARIEKYTPMILKGRGLSD